MFAFQCCVKPHLKAQGDWASDYYTKYITLFLRYKLVTTSAMASGILSL